MDLQAYNGTGLIPADSPHHLFYSPCYDQVQQLNDLRFNCFSSKYRLVKTAQGALRVVPRTTVKTEETRVLGSAINVTWSSAKWVYNVLHQTINAIDGVVKPMFNFPPGAEAAVTHKEEKEAVEDFSDSCQGDNGSKNRGINRRVIIERFEKIEMALAYLDSIQNNLDSIEDPLKFFEGEIKSLDLIMRKDPTIIEKPSFIKANEIFNRYCSIVDDLTKLVNHYEKDYRELVEYWKSCENFDNVRCSLKEILTDLDLENSPYSPNSPNNLLLTIKPLSLQLNQSLLCVEYELYFDPSLTLLEYLNQIFRVRDKLTQFKYSMPSWLFIRLGSEEVIDNLNNSLEEIKTNLERAIKSQERFIYNTLKKEKALQKKELPQLLAKIYEKQNKILAQRDDFRLIECIVEKKIDNFPVSWRFVKKVDNKEILLFNVTYESDERMCSKDRIS